MYFLVLISHRMNVRESIKTFSVKANNRQQRLEVCA
jgi:hypothetical protein